MPEQKPFPIPLDSLFSGRQLADPKFCQFLDNHKLHTSKVIHKQSLSPLDPETHAFHRHISARHSGMESKEQGA